MKAKIDERSKTISVRIDRVLYKELQQLKLDKDIPSITEVITFLKDNQKSIK